MYISHTRKELVAKILKLQDIVAYYMDTKNNTIRIIPNKHNRNEYINYFIEVCLVYKTVKLFVTYSKEGITVKQEQIESPIQYVLKCIEFQQPMNLSDATLGALADFKFI